jgi:hypothetical protein
VRHRDGLWHRRAAASGVTRRASGPLGNDARAIAFSGGRVFLGGGSGISVLDLATGAWRSWTAAQGLLAGTIRDLVIDGKVLWYVTMRVRLECATRWRWTWTRAPLRLQVATCDLAGSRPAVAAEHRVGLYDIERNEWHAIGPEELRDGLAAVI